MFLLTLLGRFKAVLVTNNKCKKNIHTILGTLMETSTIFPMRTVRYIYIYIFSHYDEKNLPKKYSSNFLIKTILNYHQGNEKINGNEIRTKMIKHIYLVAV